MKPAEKFIHVDLDCLLDTRQGTLLAISPQVAYEITSKENYHARESDEFTSQEYGTLSTELFEQVKDKYKQEILFKSIKTKMYLFLQELIESYVKMALSTPHVSTVTLVVNLYPYKLTDTQVEYLMKAIIAHLGNAAAVSIVNFNINELTLKEVSERYQSIIVYDPVPWLNSKSNELKSGVLKDVTVYLPKMNKVRALTAKERKELGKNIPDIYKFTEMVFAGFVRLSYVPVEYFCADVPYERRKIEESA